MPAHARSALASPLPVALPPARMALGSPALRSLAPRSPDRRLPEPHRSAPGDALVVQGSAGALPDASKLPDARLRVGTATLGLGHLHERRGDTLIRIPVHRRQQDPGCEWHAHRVAGRLLRLDLTCEAMEDWMALAAASPGLVPTLYRDILGREDIPAADLFWARDVFVRGPDGPRLAFAAGSYNPLNPWNTVRGAVHLNGPAGDSPLRGGLRLPDAGLIRLDSRDVTADVLHPRGRDDRTGHVRRLEVAPPPGADYALDDLTLPGREPFTPLGLVRRLAVGMPRHAWDGDPDGAADRDDEVDLDAYAIPEPRTMPGLLVAAAMLRPGPAAHA